MEEIKEAVYKNPLMENYEVEGQMDIFAFVPETQKEAIPFDLCMNPPIEG